MKILKGVEIPITICVSYTILSIVNTVFELVKGTKSNPINALFMLLFTSIAVFVLSIHHLFDEWNPLLMILVQYVIAIGLVMLVVFLGSFVEPVDEGGYRDIFLSFTIPYAIGAVFYYIEVFRSAHRQDELLQEIKQEAAKNFRDFT